MSKQYLNAVVEEVDTLPCSHPASINIDVANAYYSLTKLYRPKLVVEIGCFIGFSTLHIAQAVKDQGFGKVIAIDAFDWDVDAGQGDENREAVAERYRKKAGLENVLTYIKGYSTEVYPALKPELENGIDLLFIDGDHTVNGVIADFNAYYNNVRRGGYIILHDIYPEMCGCDGPRGMIDVLKLRRLVPKHIELVEMQTRDGFGIAVLRKVSSKRIVLNKFWRYMAEYSNRFLHPHKIADLKGVTIRVVDKDTGIPVQKPFVCCHQRCEESRLGGDDGMIRFEHYLPNRYMIDVEAKGYKTRYQVLLDVTYTDDNVFIIKMEADESSA